MTQRERQQRRALRLPVTFWRRGQPEQGTVGYSLNCSAGGMFVATFRPLPPNALVELEIDRPDGKVRAFAKVRHAAKYPGQLQQVFKSGMGVEFLHPDDPDLSSLSRMGQSLADRGGRRTFPR